jgi:serine protease Do
VPDQNVVKKTLGIELANMSGDLRKRYNIKDTVNGVVITGIDASSPAADKRLSPGDVIIEIAQEAVANTDDFQAKVDKLKKDGRKSALLLIAGADGELRFVALSLQ